jgi:23S rRNA (cytidine1920-2'-O)/16S rRNA (cytidine1409-2'-O)-methyltransferase
VSRRGQRPRGGRRADELLVEAGLAADRDEAVRLILAGKVLAGTERVDKAGELLSPDSDLVVRGRRRFVSRGGLKLERALDSFGVDPTGRVCLDAGASTGGFSDCLLQRGAAHVYSVDVGYGQLAWALRGDDRVTVLERTNVRNLRRETLDPAPTLVVADLSFLSLAGILSALVGLAGPGGELVLLVKPQFEVGRQHLDGGIVRDDNIRRGAVDDVVAVALDCGVAVTGPIDSPVSGADGNREYLLRLQVPVTP